MAWKYEHHIIPENEIAFEKKENAYKFLDLLMDEYCYVAMLSREENLYIVNYVWADNADRNMVAFGDRLEIEEYFVEPETDEEEENNYVGLSELQEQDSYVGESIQPETGSEE